MDRFVFGSEAARIRRKEDWPIEENWDESHPLRVTLRQLQRELVDAANAMRRSEAAYLRSYKLSRSQNVRMQCKVAGVNIGGALAKIELAVTLSNKVLGTTNPGILNEIKGNATISDYKILRTAIVLDQISSILNDAMSGDER